MNTPNCIPGGTKTCDPEGVTRGGGFDRGVPESGKIGFCCVQYSHCKVAWLAQSSILLVLTAENIKGLRPGGLCPKNSN
jgi:hypothetical protein